VSDTEELWVWLHWKDDGFQFQVDKAKYSLMEWRGEIAKSEKSLLEWGAAFALPIAAATAMVVTTNELIQAAERYQDQVQQFAYVTGMSTDATQKWRAAAIATDTDFGAFTQSMQYLNATIGDQGAAGDELRSKLDALGIQYRDANGDLIDNDTLMRNILARLGSMSTAQERDAAAKAILGRSWYNLAEMINNADDALVAYANHDPAFSQEDLDNIDEFKTKWAELADQVEIAKARIGLPIANALLGVEDLGALVGVEASSLVMGVSGTIDFLKTGNRAGMVEAGKRIFNPAAYTQDALAAQQAAALKTAGGGGTAAEKTFTDKYAGLSGNDLQMKIIEDQLATAIENRNKALTEADYDKYSLQIAQLTDKEIALKDSIAETAKKAEADAIDSLTAATDKYADSLQRVVDLEQDRVDITADTIEDLEDAVGLGGDQFRSIMKNYRRSMRESDQDLGIAGENVRAAGAAVYNEATGNKVKSGDLIIQLDGKEIRRVKGVADTTRNETISLSDSDLTKAGVRLL